jgi:hypothetical protein|tara:strand:+ start:260 stop:454 length:195 start_codon:yes stop_codon:yes gene_type:complete
MDKQRKTKELEMDDVKLFNTTTTTWTIGRNRNNYGKLTTKWKNENRLDAIFTKLAKKTKIINAK